MHPGRWIGCLALVCLSVPSCYAIRSGLKSALSPVPKDDGDRYVKVSMGYTHACALKKNGSVVCWGDIEKGSPVPRAPGKFVALDAGHMGTHGIKADGSLVYWAEDSEVSPGEGSKEKYVQVASGHKVSCGVLGDRTARCWGGVRFSASSPDGIAEVAVGMEHICLRTQSGKVACYGPQTPGCLTAPEGVFVQIDTNPFPAMNMQVCGVKQDRSIACWGYDRYKSTGKEIAELDAQAKAEIKTLGGGSVGDQIRAQHATDMHQSADRMRAQTGQVANTTAALADVAAALMALGVVQPLFYSMFRDRVRDWGLTEPPAGEFQKVEVNGGTNCALRTDGTIACWGQGCDKRVELCDPPPWKFVDLSMGASCGCGVRTDGRLACWGGDVAGVCTPP